MTRQAFSQVAKFDGNGGLDARGTGQAMREDMDRKMAERMEARKGRTSPITARAVEHARVMRAVQQEHFKTHPGWKSKNPAEVVVAHRDLYALRDEAIAINKKLPANSFGQSMSMAIQERKDKAQRQAEAQKKKGAKKRA